MGKVKRYVRRQAKRAGGFLKKRYAPAGRIDVGRIAKDLAVVKNALNVESKYFDRLHTPSVFGGTTYVYPLTQDIAMGTTQSQRIGSSLKLNSIQIAGFVQRDSAFTGVNAPSLVRMMLVLDKEPIGAALDNGTITSFLLSQNSVISLRNINYAQTGRFRVMMDRVYNIDGTKSNTVVLKAYKNLELRVKYNTTSTTVYNNNLYILLFTDGPVDSTIFNVTTRIKYVDN